MPQFKDSKGRTWDIAVDVNVAKRVARICGVSILDLYGVNTLEKVFGDVVLLVDILYVVCQEQSESRGISDVEFGQAMVGDVLTEASNALLESVAAFFPKRKKEMLNRMHQASLKAAELMIDADKKALAAAEDQFWKSVTPTQA